MSNDLQYWERPPGFIFGGDGYFIGSIEDWAAQLVQEQEGYDKDHEDEADSCLNWVHDPIDDEFSECQVWLLACWALGLGLGNEVDGLAFVVDDGLANALLRSAAGQRQLFSLFHPTFM